MGMMADANQKDLTVLTDMLQSGKIKPVIDRTYKLSARSLRQFGTSKTDTLEQK